MPNKLIKTLTKTLHFQLNVVAYGQFSVCDWLFYLSVVMGEMLYVLRKVRINTILE